MKTVSVTDLVDSDFPCVCVRVSDGAATLYYPGDVIPLLPEPTPAELAAIEAAQVKDYADATAAKAYNKLKQLMQMTPDEVRAWVTANVTNLAQAQDAIATLAIAVGVLARKL